jgi:hypothetical protein
VKTESELRTSRWFEPREAGDLNYEQVLCFEPLNRRISDRVIFNCVRADGFNS